MNIQTGTPLDLEDIDRYTDVESLARMLQFAALEARRLNLVSSAREIDRALFMLVEEGSDLAAVGHCALAKQ